MAKLTDETRKQLKDSGQWEDFVHRREELKTTMIPKDALRTALEEFLTSDNSVKPKESQALKSEKVEGYDDTGLKSDVSSAADVSSAGDPSGVLGGPSTGITGREPLPFIDLDQLGEKTGSEVEIIRWVADNMAVKRPDPATCPGPAAWGLLSHCRLSPLASAEFWKTTYPKLLPSRAQMEGLGKFEDTDGSKATDVLDDLMKLSEEARGIGHC